MKCPKCRHCGVYKLVDKPYVGALYRCLYCGWFGGAVNRVSYGKWYFSGVLGRVSWVLTLALPLFSVYVGCWHFAIGRMPDDMDCLEP